MTGDPPPPTKRCRKCGETKSVEAFALNGKYRRTECKTCLREQVAGIRRRQETGPSLTAFIMHRNQYGYAVRQLEIPLDLVEEYTVKVDASNHRGVVLARLEARLTASAVKNGGSDAG